MDVTSPNAGPSSQTGVIVDAHTHLLPHRLARRIREFFEAHMATELAYGLSPEALLDSHAEAGITTIWNLPYAHKPGMAAGLNESMAALELELTGRGVDIVTGCTAHVADADPAQLVDDAVRNFDAGFCKLHCSVGDYSPDDPRFTELWERVAELGIPVVVHAGHATSGYTEATELDPVEHVARRHPGATVIIAHCGHHAYREALELVDTYDNVYADLTPVVHDRIPLTAADLERHHAKLLFGTDAPNTGVTARTQLSWLGDELSTEARDAILGGTAQRLIERSSVGRSDQTERSA